MDGPGRLKVSAAARLLNVTPLTVRRGIYAGRIPSIKTDTGRLFVPMSWIETQLGEKPRPDSTRCAIYARESSSENKAALASQTDGLRRYAVAKGYQIVSVIQEVGSGVNDERKRLHALIRRRDFDVLLVEHKDRLTRFGFRWFEALAPFRVEVINVAEDATHDLMEDLVSVVTSFCARLYGQRRGRKKTEAAIAALRS